MRFYDPVKNLLLGAFILGIEKASVPDIDRDRGFHFRVAKNFWRAVLRTSHQKYVIVPRGINSNGDTYDLPCIFQNT